MGSRTDNLDHLGRSRIRRATLAHHGRNAPNALPLGTRTPREISGALQARLNTLLDPPVLRLRIQLADARALRHSHNRSV